MTPDRRDLLQGLAALAVAGPALAQRDGAEPGPALTGARPATRTPGKAGDFDFLNGQWTIRNHRQREGRWESFDGEARCFGILDGLCSVEELRIPSRDFAGLGLRILDMKTRLWADHWVNAKSGVVGSPGLPGSFEAGAGVFENEEDGVLYRSVWDLITPRSCRWQQGVSRDGGKTWQLDWSMDWTRKA